MRDIEDITGLSADARRLFDWMTAAFTGDVNEALADAQASGTSISKWPHERLRKAHAELKERGVLTADAPALEPTAPTRGHATKKSARQLDAEISQALAKTTSPISPVATPAKHKRLTKAQIKKLRVELRKAIKVEQEEAEYRHRYMNEDDYQRAGDNAIKAAGIYGKAAGQAGDDGVEIWEVVPGEGTVDDQIAEWHEPKQSPRFTELIGRIR
jgi:hypothetical protein